MLALALTLALSAPPAQDQVRVAILGLRNDGVDARAVSQVVDALALHLSQHPRAEVLTTTEIQAVLGLEAAKQAMDCDDGACAALDELTKALDVKYIVGGSVSPRAGGVLVHLSLVDVQRAVPVVRAAADAELDDLADDLTGVANELAVAAFGSPAVERALLRETASGLPPLSWIGVATGGLGLVVGTLGGILWAVDDATIRDTSTLFDAKEDARQRYLVDQALLGAGVGVLVLGAGVATLGLVLQE